MDKKLGYDDISLIPSITNPGLQKINLEVVDILDQTGYDRQSYPIFTAPMDGIIDVENWQQWTTNKIKVIIPRTIPIETRLESVTSVWTAFSISEVKQIFLDNSKKGVQAQFHVSIDCGNCGDLKLLDLCARLKQFYGDQLLLMVGNLGNPELYQHLSRAMVDYVRVGIASGSLVDKSHYGFDYPMASLLMEIQKARKLLTAQGGGKTKVIADGGIKCHSDILKALALGADYVMIGRQFIQLIESSAPIYRMDKDPSQPHKEWPTEIIGEALAQLSPEKIIKHKYYKLYHANTSPEVLALQSGYGDVTAWRKKAGGKEKIGDGGFEWVRITGTLEDWIKEFREVAGYGFLVTGATNWEEFKTKSHYVPV